MPQHSTKIILEHYDDLILLGQKLIATRQPPAAAVFTSDFVDVTLANQWFVSCINLIQRTIGNDSEHYAAMKRLYTSYPKWPEVSQAYGVLIAAKHDIETNAFFDTKLLITAELFDELLDQGRSLLDAGYFAPAAVVVGCVLENSLRKLCTQHCPDIGSNSKLDTMNSSLAKANIYNLLTQKKITALADIRNSAAHGNWNLFTKEDVQEMLKWVESFVEKQYS